MTSQNKSLAIVADECHVAVDQEGVDGDVGPDEDLARRVAELTGLVTRLR